MSEFYTFPQHEVLEALRDSRVDVRKPFSRSYLKTPAGLMIEACEHLRTHLIHDRENTGVTDEELDAIRSIHKKMDELKRADLEFRRKQDLILRCLHPDGCYRPYLGKDVILEAYGIIPVDPVEGIRGIPLGHISDKLDELHKFLQTKVHQLELQHRGW